MSTKALNNLGTATENLLQNIKEVGIPNATRQIETQLESILSSYARNQVNIDLICYGESFHESENTSLKTLFPERDAPGKEHTEKQDFSFSLDGIELIWHVYDWTMPVNKSSGLQNSALLVAYIPADAPPEQTEEWHSHFNTMYPDYSGVLIWSEENTGKKWALSEEEKRNMIDSQWVDLNQEAGFKGFLEENYSAARLQVFSLAQSVLALEANNTIFGLILDQEERNNKGKKALNMVTENASLSKEGGNTKASKLISQLKSEFNSVQTSFIKGLEKKYADFFQPASGPFKQLTDALLNELSGLEETQGTKQNTLRIPDKFQQYFKSQLKSDLSQQMLNDIKSANDLLHESAAELMQKLERNSNAHLGQHVGFMTTDAMNSLLEGLGHSDRNYEGSVTKKGAYEYFMAMRKYQMLVFMMASSLGLTFFKNMRLYMIPLTIVLIGYGAYSVSANVRKEREEGTDKELGKAKDHLLNLAKNMASEVNRYWIKQMQEHLKAEFSAMIVAAESALKSEEEKQGQLEEQAKLNSQRTSAGFEMMDKKIETARKNRNGWERTLSRLKTDLRLAYNQVMRDERARERELRRKV
ncbi:MAG: hypothetical protein EP332_07230 [Bacteroidetes bacterium]|nr:MAG: hypothetical protein EP332_07230 [Bacteroidota bacterium]